MNSKQDLLIPVNQRELDWIIEFFGSISQLEKLGKLIEYSETLVEKVLILLDKLLRQLAFLISQRLFPWSCQRLLLYNSMDVIHDQGLNDTGISRNIGDL